MNKQKRTSLKKAASYLSLAADIIQDVKYEEEDSLRNLPENLENSERYENMEKAVDCLDDALSSIQEAESCVSEAINC